MGKVTGFLEIDRQEPRYQPAADRINHWHEFTMPLPRAEVQRQAARCMDCGIPYCHGPTGCPTHNEIPEWNDLVYSGAWAEAVRNLHATNNFPEFTGRVCPAPCEEACTLNLENAPVTIKCIEQTIADKAWEMGLVLPEPPTRRTGRRVAIIGSGPAGLAGAQQLARAGHEVHVFEREPKAGGLLRYGIPDFKMEKGHIDRRIGQMEAEGVQFHYGVMVDGPHFQELVDSFDALLLAIGAEAPRDPTLPGQELAGVHYAMPYLVQQNRRVGGEPERDDPPILANGKHVVVIGGGDTASDCVGTAFRQGALSVTQLDIRPCPPEQEDKLAVWPYWPTKMRTSSSQAEGAAREFAAATLALEGEGGRIFSVLCARVDAQRVPIPGTEFRLPADLVLLAIGFKGPVQEGLLTDSHLALDTHGAVRADDKTYVTSHPKVFTAGDARRGQSLVVWAIREGRQAARAIDVMLMGESVLAL